MIEYVEFDDSVLVLDSEFDDLMCDDESDTRNCFTAQESALSERSFN